MFIGGKKGNKRTIGKKRNCNLTYDTFRLCVTKWEHTLCSDGTLHFLKYEEYFPCQKYVNAGIILHYLKLS